MATFLFKDIIFGPVQSRRLGVSLGVNLLPVNQKLCTFNCIYCECGLNTQKGTFCRSFKEPNEIIKLLELKLKELSDNGKSPDVITFAGNGEPTLHPSFAQIIDETIRVRDLYCPETRIAVLSNATRIQVPDVFKALLKVDDNIQKIDSVFPETIKILNNPDTGYDLKRITDYLKKLSGKVIIQTLFLKGTFNGTSIDNSTENEVDAWINLLKEISPRYVMIYSIARRTPFDTLEKIAPERMTEIEEKLKKEGISVQVTY